MTVKLFMTDPPSPLPRKREIFLAEIKRSLHGWDVVEFAFSVQHVRCQLSTCEDRVTCLQHSATRKRSEMTTRVDSANTSIFTSTKKVRSKEPRSNSTCSRSRELSDRFALLSFLLCKTSSSSSSS